MMLRLTIIFCTVLLSPVSLTTQSCRQVGLERSGNIFTCHCGSPRGPSPSNVSWLVNGVIVNEVVGANITRNVVKFTNPHVDARLSCEVDDVRSNTQVIIGTPENRNYNITRNFDSIMTESLQVGRLFRENRDYTVVVNYCRGCDCPPITHVLTLHHNHAATDLAARDRVETTPRWNMNADLNITYQPQTTESLICLEVVLSHDNEVLATASVRITLQPPATSSPTILTPSHTTVPPIVATPITTPPCCSGCQSYKEFNVEFSSPSCYKANGEILDLLPSFPCSNLVCINAHEATLVVIFSATPPKLAEVRKSFKGDYPGVRIHPKRRHYQLPVVAGCFSVLVMVMVAVMIVICLKKKVQVLPEQQRGCGGEEGVMMGGRANMSPTLSEASQHEEDMFQPPYSVQAMQQLQPVDRSIQQPYAAPSQQPIQATSLAILPFMADPPGYVAQVPVCFYPHPPPSHVTTSYLPRPPHDGAMPSTSGSSQDGVHVLRSPLLSTPLHLSHTTPVPCSTTENPAGQSPEQV